jgi:signal transduction histidine kinase
MYNLDTRYRNLLENFTTGVVIHDADTQVLFSNQAALNILGLTQDQIRGKVATDPKWKFIREDESTMPLEEFPVSRVIISGKKVQNLVLGLIRPDLDFPKWAICNAHPEFDESGKLIQVVVNFTDITEQKKVEKDLNESMELQSRFMNVAAHELRTPVTTFSLLLQLTKRSFQKGIPVDGSVLDRLLAQSSRLSRLVLDLLDVSRLSRGEFNLKKEEIDLNSVVSECLDDIKLIDDEREINFTPLNQKLMLNVDKTRIFQVISNLIENAIKYTPENSPIQISLETGSNYSVKLSVKDHGLGIPKEQIQNLFSPFSRGHSDLEIKKGGLGLGLFVCKGIIEMHGGTIGVESNEGQGSNFFFTLPLTQ